MNHLLAASAAALLVLVPLLPAHAGGSPPRFDISFDNGTGSPVIVQLYNNDDTLRAIEASKVQIAKGQSGSGHCNTNGSCWVRVCAFLAGTYGGASNCDAVRSNSQVVGTEIKAASKCYNVSYGTVNVGLTAC